MMQWKFQPNTRFRSPLARFAAAALGVVIIVAVGLFALGALAIVAVVLAIAFGIRRLTGATKPAAARPAPAAAAQSAHQIIDGDFVVVEPASQAQRR